MSKNKDSKNSEVTEVTQVTAGTRIADLPNGSEIHLGGQAQQSAGQIDCSDPLVKATIAGGVAGVAGYVATDYSVNNSLLKFDTAVAEATVKDIKEMGLSGGLASGSSVFTDGSGIAGGIIKERNYMHLLQQPEHWLARFTHNLGGRSVISMAVGAAAALAGFMAFKGGKNHQTSNHQESQHVGQNTNSHNAQSSAVNSEEQSQESWSQRVEEGNDENLSSDHSNQR